MLIRSLATILRCSLVLTAVTHGAEEEPDETPAVTKLDVTADRVVFDDATRSEPLELSSAEDAKKYFNDEQLKALDDAVDWDKQVVLVFAWRGSGQDRLTTQVREGEDGLVVHFRYTPGRTRDLRPHVYIYAVRSGVAWQAP